MNRLFKRILSIMAIAIIGLSVIAIFPANEVGKTNIKNYQTYDIHNRRYNEYLAEQEALRLQKIKEHEIRIATSRSISSVSSKPTYSTDFMVKSNLTVEQLEKGLLKTSRGYAQSFIDAEKKYGINALLLASLSAEESGWMEEGWSSRNNVFGYCYGKRYDSIEECIDEVAGKLIEDYLTPEGKYYGGGTKIENVNKKYCLLPDSKKTDWQWSKNIKVISKNIYRRATE